MYNSPTTTQKCIKISGNCLRSMQLSLRWLPPTPRVASCSICSRLGSLGKGLCKLLSFLAPPTSRHLGILSPHSPPPPSRKGKKRKTFVPLPLFTPLQSTFVCTFTCACFWERDSTTVPAEEEKGPFAAKRRLWGMPSQIKTTGLEGGGAAKDVSMCESVCCVCVCACSASARRPSRPRQWKKGKKTRCARNECVRM